MTERIVFIGGGNMASALIAGLLKQGLPAAWIDVIDPLEETRDKLQCSYSVNTFAAATDRLGEASFVVWAVKPQVFRQATAAVAGHTRQALHLSVAAGIRSASIAQWLGTDRVVRAMPNTPALIGKGIAGLFARSGADATDCARVDQLLASTGETLWFDAEEALDAVTALSGSGPAYAFYFMEAMTTAGVEMGLQQAQARQLAVATFRGASELAYSDRDSLQVLRQRVTSKGGTTHAAITAMEDNDVRAIFIDALYAARARGRSLGDEFGSS